MRIRLAKRIGFCFGVKRAIEMAEKALEYNDDVYSLGSVIHNRQVVKKLSDKGLKVVRGIDGIKGGTVVVSSHGISPAVAGRIREKGLKLIDTTCPFVLNAQRIAKSLGDEGYRVVIVGDSEHPEVKALRGFVPDVCVVKNKKEAMRLAVRPHSRISVISQTTQSTANFLDVVRVITGKKPGELKVINTICKDVEERQNSAVALARKVDAMLVIGGRNSANTRRLFELCRKICRNSHLLETERDIRRGWYDTAECVGITSGASTPDWIVKRVVEVIRVKHKAKSAKRLRKK
ncbi:MAG: 4-hydroxy-3-methylbut-2-enyl diphosphate reductase [Candidatus Omnitrophota bacterium]